MVARFLTATAVAPPVPRGRGRRHPLLTVTATLACLLLFVALAAGEEPAATEVVLGLPELIERAVARSPELAAARSDIDAAHSELAQALAGRYPQLESTALFGPVPDAKEPRVNRQGSITDPSPSASIEHLGIFGRLDLTVTQPLYTFGKLSNREDAARSGLKARENGLDACKGKLVLHIKELYYALVVARAGAEAAGEAEGFFADAAANIRRLLAAGADNVKEGDLYVLAASQAGTARSRAEAEKGARVAAFGLKALAGIPADQELVPADTSLSLPAQQLAAADHYVKEARRERPELKQLNAALTSREAMMKAAAADRWPSLFAAMQGSLAGAPDRDSLDNPYIRDEFNHAELGVVGGIQWHWDFGIAEGRLSQARAEYEKLRHEKNAAEISIPLQVVNCYQEHLQWRQAAISYREAAVATRKWVVAAMANFGMGVGSAEEMLRAIEKYGENQGRYLEALFRANLSLAELEYATGGGAW